MAVERATSGSSLIDVLDRVLDKGIVIDAWCASRWSASTSSRLKRASSWRRLIRT